MSQERGNRSTRVGIVVSNKMDKTVVVRVDNLVKHRV
ncbi:MAG: 30S ribosomal protein S17, partial [Deltaproteobacteria bacterium]